MLTAVSTTIPPPVGGWNARDPLDVMAASDAIKLENVFPGTNKVEVRRGHESYATGLGIGVVETLAEFVGKDGTRKFLAAANLNIYDISSAGAGSSLKSSLTNNRWQTINFNGKLIMVNGADQPQQYDDSAGITDATYTGTGLTDNDFIHVCAYRNRLYFVEKNESAVWYGGVDSITGATTEFNVQSLWNRGGFLMACGTMTLNSGAGIDDHFVMVSNMGEVLVYSGSYPGDSAWTLIAHLHLPVVIGRRCLVKMAGELVVITEDGIYPISEAISSQRSLGDYKKLSDKISEAYASASRRFIDNYGWQGCIYPKRQWAVFNIPTQDGVQSHQYVMNTVTGAWCKFTGMNAITWGLYNEEIYFGGTDGVVYKADTGTADNSGSVAFDIKTAYNYFGDRTKVKQFTLGMPVIVTNSNITFDFDIDTDYENTTPSSQVSITNNSGADWDVDEWDVGEWGEEYVRVREWYSLHGVGRAGAVMLKGTFLNASFELSAIQISYVPGGIL